MSSTYTDLLREILERLERIESMIGRLEELLMSSASGPGGREVRAAAKLPSYLIDNPWVEILSRRGEGLGSDA